MRGAGNGAFRIAALDIAFDEQVAGPLRVHKAGPGCLGLARVQHRGQFGPGDRKIAQIEIRGHIARAADQRPRFASETHLLLGQGWLIGKGADNPEAVSSWYVRRSKDSYHARTASPPGFKIAKGKARAMMRRTHDQHRKRTGGEGVRPELFCSGYLWNAVQPYR